MIAVVLGLVVLLVGPIMAFAMVDERSWRRTIALSIALLSGGVIFLARTSSTFLPLVICVAAGATLAALVVAPRPTYRFFRSEAFQVEVPAPLTVEATGPPVMSILDPVFRAIARMLEARKLSFQPPEGFSCVTLPGRMYLGTDYVGRMSLSRSAVLEIAGHVAGQASSTRTSLTAKIVSHACSIKPDSRTVTLTSARPVVFEFLVSPEKKGNRAVSFEVSADGGPTYRYNYDVRIRASFYGTLVILAAFASFSATLLGILKTLRVIGP